MKRSNPRVTSFLDDVLAMEAKGLAKELRDSPMLVVLLPAPEVRHVGHMVRAVISRPPDWYMQRFYRRGKCQRHRFMRALQRVAEGLAVRGRYQAEIVEYLTEKINGGGKEIG